MRDHHRLLGISFLAALFVLAGISGARADDAAAIGYRQKVMQGNGFHAGSIGAILKGEWPHKEDAAAHAKALAANAMLITNAFKAQTGDVKTDAKPEIWKDWTKFEEKVKGLETESAKLADVAASGNTAEIGAQMKKVGEACGACHKEFRKPKEQSYKN
jgi:cytochrome c556